jgi:hypothetical protein
VPQGQATGEWEKVNQEQAVWPVAGILPASLCSVSARFLNPKDILDTTQTCQDAFS